MDECQRTPWHNQCTPTTEPGTRGQAALLGKKVLKNPARKIHNRPPHAARHGPTTSTHAQSKQSSKLRSTIIPMAQVPAPPDRVPTARQRTLFSTLKCHAASAPTAHLHTAPQRGTHRRRVGARAGCARHYGARVTTRSPRQNAGAGISLAAPSRLRPDLQTTLPSCGRSGLSGDLRGRGDEDHLLAVGLEVNLAVGALALHSVARHAARHDAVRLHGEKVAEVDGEEVLAVGA